MSCVSTRFCMAVGSVEQPGQGVTLAEVYDGVGWNVVPTPDVPGATDNELLGVSCSSQTACTAVGFSQSQGGAQTLAERWNGTGWAIQPTPLVMRSGLAAVSCASATACTAVGGSGSFPNAAGSALAERWNGTALVDRADPAGRARLRRGVAGRVVRVGDGMHGSRRGIQPQGGIVRRPCSALERELLVDEAEVRQRL